MSGLSVQRWPPLCDWSTLGTQLGQGSLACDFLLSTYRACKAAAVAPPLGMDDRVPRIWGGPRRWSPSHKRRCTTCPTTPPRAVLR